MSCDSRDLGAPLRTCCSSLSAYVVSVLILHGGGRPTPQVINRNVTLTQPGYMSCTSTTSGSMQCVTGLGHQPTVTTRLHKYVFPFKVTHHGSPRSLTRSLKYCHVDIQRKQTCLQPTLTTHRGAHLRFVTTNAVKSETKVTIVNRSLHLPMLVELSTWSCM